MSDKPGKPSAPTVVPVSNDTVNITWEAPESDGGSAIGNYVVERRDVNSTRGWIQASKTIIRTNSYELTGLIEGTTYEFRVSAENDMGIGLPSESSEPYKCEPKIGRESTILRILMTAIYQSVIAVTEGPKFTEKLEDTIVIEGAKVKLSVKYTGKPTPTVQWFRNGKEIFDGRRMWAETNGESSTLSIAEMREEDEGQYSVAITNRFGADNSRAKLLMEGMSDYAVVKRYNSLFNTKSIFSTTENQNSYQIL